MRLPKSWLQDYVDFNVTDEEFIERMMWRGFELEGVEKELKDVSGVMRSMNSSSVTLKST